jgi:alkanesulfonate monooxygenase
MPACRTGLLQPDPNKGPLLNSNHSLSENLKIFSTAAQSSAVERKLYVQRVIDIAQWSEQAGCEGILIYTDNSLVDPWLVAQIIIQHTDRLCPLVAVQPAYMHPYTVAKLVASLGHLYGRRIYLNMVAGGFSNDLAGLNDTTPHDKRYARLMEYTSIIKELLTGFGPVTYHGEFYTVNKLRLTPALDPELFPGIMVSGSSQAGLAAAVALGAIAVKYPQPAENETPDDKAVDSGIRLGIIARVTADEAWQVAHARFPGDRKGQLTHQLAMKTSDSQWHAQLSKMGKTCHSGSGSYWLWPFQNYNTFCPYLVGSYDEVASGLEKYVTHGFRTFILDIPPSADELKHTSVVFSRIRPVASQ